MERRKHQRFSATAFLNRPVILTPLHPYIGKPIKGKLIDMSASGLSMLIGQIIPQGTRLHMILTFPDHSKLESEVTVTRTMPRERHFLHGFEFLNIDQEWIERLNNMSAHFIDCEQRIKAMSVNPCIGASCAFFNMCNKQERTNLIVNIDEELLLNLSSLTPHL